MLGMQPCVTTFTWNIIHGNEEKELFHPTLLEPLASDPYKLWYPNQNDPYCLYCPVVLPGAMGAVRKRLHEEFHIRIKFPNLTVFFLQKCVIFLSSKGTNNPHHSVVSGLVERTTHTLKHATFREPRDGWSKRHGSALMPSGSQATAHAVTGQNKDGTAIDIQLPSSSDACLPKTFAFPSIYLGFSRDFVVHMFSCDNKSSWNNDDKSWYNRRSKSAALDPGGLLERHKVPLTVEGPIHRRTLPILSWISPHMWSRQRVLTASRTLPVSSGGNVRYPKCLSKTSGILSF